MTSWATQCSSSQSVSVFFGPLRPENPKTDWDDKPGLPRVVIPVCFKVFGSVWPENPETDWDPGSVSQSVSGIFGPFRPESPKTDWDDKPGLPRVVIPGFFAPFEKTPKQTGITSLGFPRLSSQSVSGYFGPFRPESPETDWDDKPGLFRAVIPLRFKVFWSARKTRKGLG